MGRIISNFRVDQIFQSSFVKSFLLIIFSIFLLFQFLPYYPLKFRYFFTIIFLIILIFSYKIPKYNYFLFFFLLPFLGNHPGGRFLEFFDFLVIVFILNSQNKKRNSFILSKTNVYIFLFILLACLSVILNQVLLFDLTHYNINFFYFLHSSELEPYFPIKQIFLTILFLIYNSIALRNKNYLKFSLLGFVIGYNLVLLIGFVEFFSNNFSHFMDIIHVWIDQYVDRNQSHYFILGSKYQSINSVFWNRSWFSMYLISGLGICSIYFCIIKKNTKLYLMQLLGIMISSLLIGSRGGIYSIIVFILIIVLLYVLKKFNFSIKSFSYLFSILFLFILCLQMFLMFIPLETNLDRYNYAQAAWILLKNSPLLGFGVDSFGWCNEYILRYYSMHTTFHSSHSEYLQILSGQGIVGLIVYSLIIFATWKKGFLKKKQKSHYLIVFASLFAILFYQLFQEWKFIKSTFIPFLFILLFLLRNSYPLRNSKYFYFFIFISILSLTSIHLYFYSIKKEPGYGLYFNPTIHSKIYILEGEFIPTDFLINSNLKIDPAFIDLFEIYEESSKNQKYLLTQIQFKRGLKYRCISSKNHEKFQVWEMYFSKFILNPDSRKICTILEV